MILDGRRSTPAADLLDVLWRNLLVAALFGALGVWIGALIRNQAAALVFVLICFVIEPTLLGLVPDVGRYAPLQGAPTWPGSSLGDEASDMDLLAPGVAALVMHVAGRAVRRLRRAVARSRLT